MKVPLRKTINFLLIVLPMAAMITAAVPYVRRSADKVIDNLHEIISHEASARLGCDAKVEKAVVRNIGRVALYDVTVTARDKSNKNKMRFGRIDVKYNWRNLIKTRKLSELKITEIDIVRPELDIDNDVMKMFTLPKSEKSEPFKAPVKVIDGDIKFFDKAKNTRFDLSDVYATLMGTDDGWYFDFKAKNNDSKVDVIALEGIASAGKTFSLDGRASLRNADLVFAKNYFNILPTFKLTSGRSDTFVSVSVKPVGNKLVYEYDSNSFVRNGTLRLPGFNETLSKVSGNVYVGNDITQMDLTAHGCDGDLKVVGNVVNFKKPSFTLNVSSPSINVQKLINAAPFASSFKGANFVGRAAAAASATGTLDNPDVTVTMKLPALTYAGYALDNILFAGRYGDKMFSVNSASFDALGGKFRVGGTVRMADMALALSCRVAGADISRIRAARDFKPSGRVDGDVAVTGTLASPRVKANVSTKGFSAAGYTFGRSVASVDISKSGVKISDFETADIFGGYAKAAGTYKNGVFDMRFAAPGADVGRVGSFFGAGGLTGTAFVSGTLTGTAANPKTNAVAEVHGFGAGDNKIDFARIPFSTSGRTVSFNDAELAVFPAGAVLNGSVTPSKDGKEITYEGKARLSRLDIATLNKKLQTKLPGNGVLSGDFDISGTYHPGTEITLDTIMNSDMKLSGTVEFEDAAFYDFPLDKASAKVEIADRKLRISDCDAKSALASVSVSGIVDTAADTYDMDFSLKDFHLSRIRKFREEYASITGSVSGSGKITGTFDEPVITAKAESADLVLSHQRFEKALFDIDLQGNDFRNFEVSLIDGKSLLSFSGTHLDMDSKTVELAEGVAENIDMKSIWDMFRSSRFVTPSRRPRRSDSENRTEDENRKAPMFAAANNLTVGSGKLDADFRVSGSLKTPEISLDGTVKDLTVNGKRIENIDIDADGSEGTVFLRSLKVSSGNLAAEAEGLFDLDGSGTDLALRAKDLDLRELGRFVNIGDVSGTASSELRITGDLTAPEIAGFLTTENPAYGSVAFDSFDIGSVAVRDNRVEISDVSLTKGGCLVTADGYVPWDWKKFRVPKEDSLAFTVTAEDKGFDMISAFVKDIDKEKTKGDLTAFINVLGTLSEPELTGKLTVTEGTLGLHTFDNLFTSINADINLSGNSLTVDNLTASSDLGGTLYVKKGGKVTLGRNSESIDMEVVAEKLALKERNAFGLGETAETVLDADVTLTGDKLKNMLIADAKEGESGIKIGRTVVSVLKSKTAAAETVAAEPEKKKSAINFDPEFALHAESGGDLILAQPMFTVMAGGKGVIDGSLSDMTADSMLSVSKGTIKVAGNRLKITPGGNIKAMYTSGKPAEVRLDLQATANARIANAFGRRELYKIIVDVDGALDNLNIRTTSSPPGLSREQMLAAMGHVEGMLAGSNNMFENDITDAFKSVGASMLFMPIEDLFIDKLGFDDFYLDYGTAKDMSLYVSKRLFGNYFLSYYQQFSGNVVGTDNTMKLELQYRFKDRYTVGIGTDDQHAFRITADWTYLFD